MIAELAKELGIPEPSLLSLIRYTAGTDQLVYSIANDGRDVDDFTRGIRYWQPTGWSVAIIAGPSDQVAGLVPPPWQKSADYDAGWNDCLRAMKNAARTLAPRGAADA